MEGEDEVTHPDVLGAREVGLRIVAWKGELPRPGHWLATDRGRTAYLVVRVRENVRPDARSRAALRCLVLPRGQVPEDAVVHGWCWSPRG